MKSSATHTIRPALLIMIAIGLIFGASLFSHNHATSSSLPSPYNEVDNADGSPVSGRDPSSTPQATLSQAAASPGVFNTSGVPVSAPSDDDPAETMDMSTHDHHNH